MPRSLTKYDVLFFCECLVAFLFNEHGLRLSLSLFLVLVLIGLFFEILTRKFWTYSEEFRRSFFVVEGTGVSVAAAFSWAAVLTICINVTSIAVGFWEIPHATLWFSIVVVGIIGNVLETICVRWAMFRYEPSWITHMIVFKNPIMIWDVPLMVRLGYFFNFGPLCAIILYLSKGV